MFLPSTLMESAVAEISFCRLPRMESYFRRWASVLGSVRSLTATNSRFVIGERGAKNVAADAPEAVDTYFDCHFASLRKRQIEIQ